MMRLMHYNEHHPVKYSEIEQLEASDKIPLDQERSLHCVQSATRLRFANQITAHTSHRKYGEPSLILMELHRTPTWQIAPVMQVGVCG